MEADVNLTRTWLTRSGGMPLTLQIGTRNGVNLYYPPAIDPIIDLLTQHAERWEHVTLAIPHSTMNQTYVAKNRLARLCTLSIDDVDQTTLRGTKINTFKAAPQLTSLTISCNNFLHVEIP